MKRLFLLLLAAVAMVCSSGLASAETYPDRPITFIIPYPPGGNADISMRILAECVEKDLGQKMVVTPMPGAAAMVGTNKGLDSKPDGYTIFLAAQSTMSIGTQIRKVRFTWETPEYICTVASPNLYLGVSKDASQFNTFDDIITYAKAHPGELNVAQIGMTGIHQFVSLQIMKTYDIKFQTVPFDGGPPTVSAVLGKHADMLWTDNYNPAIKAILLTGESSKNYPRVKTLTELGHADIATGIYYTLCAPKGTPPEVMKTLETAFAKAANDPKYLDVLESLKWEHVWRTGVQTREAVGHEAKAVRQLIDAGLFKEDKS